LTGGIDLACEWAGIKTVAMCEKEPFCQKVLRKHWPAIPIYDDVCTLTKERLDADGIGTIDLIHGGYPCQPFSLAGNREGEEDDRHLWPEVLRLIQTIKPRWFVGENVAGHVSLGLDIVLSDLEGIGYAWESFVIPASAVNARHRRERVFIVAYSNSIGNNSEREYRIDRERQMEMQQRFESLLGPGNNSENVSNSTSQGLQEWRRSERTESAEKTGAGLEPEFERCSEDVANTSSFGQSGQRKRIDSSNQTPDRDRETSKPLHVRIRDQWTTEPNVGRVANGVPNRVDRLKALGNAVVPQQIYPILEAIKQIDEMIKEI
jgi:DNA (cytosine-5)-methyltransferase 1